MTTPNLIRFAVLNGNPVRFTDDGTAQEAWGFINGQWKRVDTAEVMANASLITPAAFGAQFPTLPALPVDAFKN